jgi:predicted DsbA family dithiol-disulfide isomerase
VLIEVYSDVVCPWCFVGEKRLEKALGEKPGHDAEVRWRHFQLRPEMPAGGLPWREFAIEKFGGKANMRATFVHVAAAGAPDDAAG